MQNPSQNVQTNLLLLQLLKQNPRFITLERWGKLRSMWLSWAAIRGGAVSEDIVTEFFFFFLSCKSETEFSDLCGSEIRKFLTRNRKERRGKLQRHRFALTIDSGPSPVTTVESSNSKGRIGKYESMKTLRKHSVDVSFKMVSAEFWAKPH